MKQTTFSSNLWRRVFPALIWAAAFTVVSCSSDVNFNPTAPDLTWRNTTLQEDRSLVISGTLEAEDGTCLKATILYNGKELEGARTACPDASGCVRMELSAATRSMAGHNTISFKVLRQSEESVDYRVEGSVLVNREGLGLGGVTMNLGPKQARLRSGGKVTFDLEISN